MTGVERGELAAVAGVTILAVTAISLVATAGRAAAPAPPAPAKAPVGRAGAPADQAAAEALPDIALDAVTLGDHASGETITKDTLAHRVVLLVFWSRTCDTCKATLPMLEQVYRSLGPAGFVMVGCHTTRGSAPEIRDTAEKLGVTFPMVTRAEVAGLDTTVVPLCLLFDHTGKAIARGTPAQIGTAAAAAVQAAPPPVLAGRHLDKLAALEKMLRSEAKFGAVLRKAETLTESEDEPTAEEATFLVEQLKAHATDLLAKADEAKDTDAVRAAGLLQRVATAYRGGDIGKEALAKQREWKRDKQFTNGLQAANLTAQLEGLRSQALAMGRRQAGRRPQGNVAGMNAAAGLPPQVQGQMAQLAAMIIGLSPGSRSAARAEEIALEFNLQLPPSP